MKPLANTIATGAATNVYKATAVYIANDATARTVTIANTGINTGDGQHGSYVGGSVTIRVPVNGSLVIRKRPMDTVQCNAATYATKVADSGA